MCKENLKKTLCNNILKVAIIICQFQQKTKTNVKRMSVIKTLWLSLKNRKSLEKKKITFMLIWQSHIL
jgi:hypothetical protein